MVKSEEHLLNDQSEIEGKNYKMRLLKCNNSSSSNDHELNAKKYKKRRLKRKRNYKGSIRN
jgi:hypothetical protein